MADRTPTLGDLCSAIAEGQVATTVEGAMYQLNVFELRRYLNRFRSLPLPTVTAVLEQSPSSRATTNHWSASQVSIV
jgi:hypothetical protein